MGAVLVISLLVCGVLGLWAMISPRSMYWTLTAWQYRHPEAVEPSDAAYSVTRVSGGIMLVFVVGITIWIAATTVQTQSEQQTQEDCRSVLLPELAKIVQSKPVTESAMQSFADKHKLTLKVETFKVLGWDPSPTPNGTVENIPVTMYDFMNAGHLVITWTDNPATFDSGPECLV